MFSESITSVGSRKSAGGRYHKVAGGARVDESLFGETAAQKLLSGKPVSGRGEQHGASAAHATMANAASRTGVGAGGAAPAAAVVVIKEDDLYRMQQGAVIKTVADVKRERAEAEVERKERAAVAEARKEKIRGMEAARVAHLPLSQLQQEEKDEKERRRELARQMRDEAQDDMKKMDSLFNFAITTAIRERQKGDKPAAKEQEKVQERMKELKAEIESLEAQRRSDEVEAGKRKKREEYRDLVHDQLEEARARKVAVREAYAKEDASRLAKLKGEIEEEWRKKGEVAGLKEAARTETIALNEAAIRAKGDRLAADREAEAQAAREMIARDLKEAAHLEEVERVRKEKDKQKSLAAGQVQRILEDAGRREELIMQRAYDEGRRRDRAKELDRLRKEAAAAKELEDARVRMAAEKQLRMAEVITGEKEEYVRAQRVQDEWLSQDRAVEDGRARANAAHLKSLQEQMEAHGRVVKDARSKEIVEEDARRAEVEAHMAHLRELRDVKVAQLKELGVDSRFTVELMKYDPWKQTMKKELVSAVERRK